MCFAIPYQVKKITKTHAILETGKKVRLMPHLIVHQHDYVELRGDFIVSVLSPEEGASIRTLLASLSPSP